MSAIFDILIQARIEQFNKVNPAGAGQYDIKPGQVIIDKIFPIPVGINGEVMVCYVNWKPSNNSVFYSDLVFKVNIDVLYNKHSKGEKDIPATELVKRLILIYEPGIAYTTTNKNIISQYNLKWTTLGKQPEYVTPENAWHYMLFANAKSLGEASNNLTNSAEDSLLAYYEHEAQVDDSLIDEITDAEAKMYDGINDCHDADNQNNAGHCHDAPE